MTEFADDRSHLKHGRSACTIRVLYAACTVALAVVAQAQSLPADISLSNVNAASGAAAYQATNSITAHSVTVSGSASVGFYAGNHISLKPGFRATAGSAAVTFRASIARAMLLSPTPGTSLPGPSLTFSWSGGGSGVTGYWLQVGNSPGADDIYGGITTSLSQTVLNIPTDGRMVYVRLWTQVDGAWSGYADYSFTAAQTAVNQPPAHLSVAPAIGSGFGTTFAVKYSDPNGASDIRWAYFVVSDPGVFGSACHVMYDAQEKLLYLLNIDGVTWQPGIHAGQNESRSTIRCTVSGWGANEDVNSTFLTARFPETYSTGWQGYKELAACVWDKGGLGTNWGNLGSYTVGSATPVTLLSPAAGATNQPSSSVMLSWAAFPGATSYDVYLGTSNPPPFVNSQSSANYTATNLTPGATYYWYVIATASARYPSAVWSFTTAAAPSISSLSINPSTVTSGTAASVQATLSGPAPAGGAAVTLTSNNGAFPMGSCALTIPPGESTGSCDVTAGQVSSSTAVTVTASYRGSSRTAQVTVTPAGITHTITSHPVGRALTVDGAACTAPCSFQWNSGTTHRIAAADQGNTSTRYLFANWSDGGAASHDIQASSTPATWTASFTTQHYLTTVANPTAGGTIAPASGWRDSGETVVVSASANSGYQFSGFSGALSGTTTPQNAVMSGPLGITANFTTLGPDFVLSVVPPQHVVQGSSVTATLTVTPSGGFNQNVTFSYANWPTGLSATFTPNPVTPNSATTIRFSASAGTPPATYDVVLTATGGSVERTQTVRLVVEAPQRRLREYIRLGDRIIAIETTQQ